MNHACEKCGGLEFESHWKGRCYQFRCAKCHWGKATTMFPPLVADENHYRITVTSLGADPKRSLIALNRHFDHGLRRTREFFSSGACEFFSGQASEVWRKAQDLRSEGVLFQIEPPFPYDLATYNPDHGHEHDWRPIKFPEI